MQNRHVLKRGQNFGTNLYFERQKNVILEKTLSLHTNITYNCQYEDLASYYSYWLAGQLLYPG